MKRRVFILSLSLLIGLLIPLTSASFLEKRTETQIWSTSSFLKSQDLLKKGSDFNPFNQMALEILLTRYNYTAAWFSENEKPKQQNEGLGPAFILNECFKNSTNNTEKSSLYCKLDMYNVDHVAKGFEAIKMYLNQSASFTFDSQNSTMNYFGVPALIYMNSDSSMTLTKSCVFDASYFFTNSKTKKPFNYTNDLPDNLFVKIKINNGDCGLDFVTPNLTPVLHKNEEGNIIKYTMIMVGIAVVQMIACGLLIWKLDGNNPLYKRTSLGTLCFLIAFDFFIYLIHFTYWATISAWMAVTFICFFVVAVFIEPVVLYHVFSAYQRRTNTSIVTLLFTIYFWFVISATCIIFSLVCFPNFIFYIYPFFLMPQIIDNFTARRKYKFNLWLICGLGLPKLLYIAYLSLDPVDIFDKGFPGGMMIYAIIVIALQMILLRIQKTKPTFGYKGRDCLEYNYQCSLEESQLFSNEVCSICTEKVSLTPLNGLQQPLMEQNESSSSLNSSDIFKTPCRHHFHSECLIAWLKKKLECPNCRQKLPALPDDLEDDE